MNENTEAYVQKLEGIFKDMLDESSEKLQGTAEVYEERNETWVDLEKQMEIFKKIKGDLKSLSGYKRWLIMINSNNLSKMIKKFIVTSFLLKSDQIISNL